jgi:predicted membrane channel-forming protein YqfA (hemolysin III family)
MTTITLENNSAIIWVMSPVRLPSACTDLFGGRELRPAPSIWRSVLFYEFGIIVCFKSSTTQHILNSTNLRNSSGPPW